MINKKIPAFTIMELTISMLLTALIIGITYTSYQIISGSYLNFNNKNTDMATLLRIDELMQKDFIQSESITCAANQLVFKDSSQLIKYQFASDYIIRYSAIIDTFKIKGAAISPMFEKKSVDLISSEGQQQLIDALQLRLPFKKDTVQYYYTKIYSAQSLIKATTNAIN